jgi:hypothetical protein
VIAARLDQARRSIARHQHHPQVYFCHPYFCLTKVPEGRNIGGRNMLVIDQCGEGEVMMMQIDLVLVEFFLPTANSPSHSTMPSSRS